MPKEVQLNRIWKMLEQCVPQHSVKEKLHRYWVQCDGTIYRALPKGEHGSRRPMIPAYHVLKMVRMFSIADDCARDCFSFVPSAEEE